MECEDDHVIYGEWKGTYMKNTAAYFKVITHGIFWLTYLLTHLLNHGAESFLRS